MAKKILFYIGSLAKGGAERVLVNLAEYFVSKDYEVTILTKCKDKEEYAISDGIHRIPYDLSEEEAKVNRINKFGVRIKKLRKIFSEEKPDVIVSFLGKNNFLSVMAAKKLNIPVVVSVRATPSEEYKNLLMRIMVNPIFRKAAGVVLQTNDARDFFKKDVAKKAVVLPNSIHPDFLKGLYAGEKDNTIITVGRLDDNKNQLMLIDAFIKIANEFPETSLILYGDGPKRKEWEELVNQSGYGERIAFTGRISNVNERIHKDKIFVLPSRTEGMPNALIEAMALGLACVSTDCPCGGPKELLGNNENGLLVPVDNVDAMADALRKLLQNEELIKTYGEKAYAKAKELHPDKVNRMWEEYLVGIMDAYQKR